MQTNSFDFLGVWELYCSEIANSMFTIHAWYRRDRSLEFAIKLENLKLLKAGLSLSEAESLSMGDRRDYIVLIEHLTQIDEYKSKSNLVESLIVGNAHILPQYKRRISDRWRKSYIKAVRELNNFLFNSPPQDIGTSRFDTKQPMSKPPISMADFLAKRRRSIIVSNPSDSSQYIERSDDGGTNQNRQVKALKTFQKAIHAIGSDSSG